MNEDSAVPTESDRFFKKGVCREKHGASRKTEPDPMGEVRCV